MLVQRNFPTRDNQISQPDAAAQHRFPKAAIELVQIGRNPNRSYAAPVTDVSHADYVAIDQLNGLAGLVARFEPILPSN